MAYSEYDRRNKVQKKQLGGGFEVYQKRNKDTKEISETAKENGKTEEQTKAGQRKPGETGLTSVDKARIASASMDIASILAAFIPGYGTAASAISGLGSTAVNLGADIADDSVSAGQAAWNTLSGVGMDLVGLIPGLGALGKAGKIAKTLKYVAPTALAIWQTYENGTAPIKAMNKLMSDETLTVDDWKALSAGLQMLAGGVRVARGNKSVNKIKNNKEAVPYNTITVKSGNTYKVSPEDYKKITSASTLEDQNIALREAIKNDTEELGSKFKTSKWEKIRHPFTSEPKTSKGIDYKDIDWTKQERIPWQYKVDNDQVKPRILSNEWLLQKTGNLTFEDPNFNLFTRKNPLYKKSGGALNLTNVRKLAKGDQVTNTISKANWFNDMFSSNAMQKWIDAYTLDDYQKFNDLQKSWSANKKATQYVPGATPLDWNQGVQDRQKLWEQTGTNATIEDLVSRGVITRPGKSGDNAEGGHVDGYFGEQEFLRHGGTEDSWKGHEAELAKFQDMLKEKGLQYTLDPESGMYLMSPIQQSPEQSPEQENIQVPTNLNIADQKDSSNTSEKKSPMDYLKDVVTRMSANPTIAYGLPRALYADRINRKMTDMAKDSIVPLLKDPFEVHRYTRSDLDAEMQGVRNYAKLRNLADNPFVSDPDKMKAYQFESESKGIDYINAGKEKSNQTQRQYEELAWQQEKENASNRHETSMFNRAQNWASKQDKSKLEQAYLSKKHNIWDTFGQQLEFDARQRLNETKALRDNFARSDIHNSVMYNPNNYGANLTNEELQVWNQVLSGVQPSSLKDKLNLYVSAQKKVSQAETDQLRQYYNIPNTKWTGQSQVVTPTYTPNISFVKKGGSLELAGIRAKTADAERFQRQIKECIDRNEKAINRLSKSMYGIIKSSIIK